MARQRPLPFSAHIGIEFLLGAALAVSPFLFDFDGGVTVVSLVLGVAAMTVALSTQIGGRAITAHQGWDRGLVVLLSVAAVVTLVIDVDVETAVFAGAAVIEGILLTITRYVPEAIG
jgi:hypothetical protein